MILTEAEAKTKWCPMARAVTPGEDHVAHNRPDGSYNCIGSGCMMWRWDDHAARIEIFQKGESDADFVKRRDFILSKRRGHCGFSGKWIGF